MQQTNLCCSNSLRFPCYMLLIPYSLLFPFSWFWREQGGKGAKIAACSPPSYGQLLLVYTMMGLPACAGYGWWWHSAAEFRHLLPRPEDKSHLDKNGMRKFGSLSSLMGGSKNITKKQATKDPMNEWSPWCRCRICNKKFFCLPPLFTFKVVHVVGGYPLPWHLSSIGWSALLAERYTVKPRYNVAGGTKFPRRYIEIDVTLGSAQNLKNTA